MEHILNREDILELLAETISQFKFQNKSYQQSPYGENFAPNQYSLLLVMDALVKYHIIIDDPELVDEYLMQVRRIVKKMNFHHDIVFGINSTLAKIVAVKLGIVDVHLLENKKKILTYIHEKYIENGYYFYGTTKEAFANINTNGLDPNDYYNKTSRWKEIKSIFSKYGMDRMLSNDVEEIFAFVTLTDSPMMAYFYALQSPFYLAELSSLNEYMKNNEQYDMGAYYKKDYHACLKNIEQLCTKHSFNNTDKERIIEIFEIEWNLNHKANAKPRVLFIKRKNIGKEQLKDFEQIKSVCENIDIAHSVGKIIESRTNEFKIYEKIPSEDIITCELPSYLDIRIQDNPYEEIIMPNKTKKLTEERMTSNLQVGFLNAYGSTSIIALLGLLSITIGVLLTIFISIYGG